MTREAFRKLPDRRLKYLFADIQGVPSLIKSNSLSESAMGYQRVGSEGTNPSLTAMKRIGPRFGLVHFGNIVVGDRGQESDMLEEENIIKQYMRQREEAKLKKQKEAQTVKAGDPGTKPSLPDRDTSATKQSRTPPLKADDSVQKAPLAKFNEGPKAAANTKHSPQKPAESSSKERVVPMRLTQISASELGMHNTRHDAWTAIRGTVYDVTEFISNHPGGPAAILKIMGQDGTRFFGRLLLTLKTKRTNIWIREAAYFVKSRAG